MHREYYNDAGNQIDNLTRSVQLRANGVEPGSEGWPEDGYRGDYIVEIGKQFVAAGGDVKDADAVRAFAVNALRNEQDKDLTAFGVKKFDCYYLKLALHRRPRRQDSDCAANWQPHLRIRRRAGSRPRTAATIRPRMRKAAGGYTYFPMWLIITSGSVASRRS